ncbi:MAG TPA: PepSY domain-containing protein [Actinocatenispora sp.]
MTGICGALAIGGATAALAHDGGGHDGVRAAGRGAARPAASAITMDQAVRAAQRKVPNATVTEIEREHEHGRTVWEVGLRRGSTEYEVDVDATTGRAGPVDVDHHDDADDD